MRRQSKRRLTPRVCLWRLCCSQIARKRLCFPWGMQNGFSPYTLDGKLRSIVERWGQYLDVLPYFREITHAEDYYFLVRLNPNARGTAVWLNS